MTTALSHRRVRDHMSRHVVTIRPHETVHDALDLMAADHVTALPVVDKAGRCIGILSQSDFLDVTRELDEELIGLDKQTFGSREWLIEKLRDTVGRQRVDELMTESPAGVSPDDSLAAAAAAMLRHKVHRLPVVNEDGLLVGIISTMDMVRAVSQEATEPLDF